MCQYPSPNGQFKPGVCDAKHDGIAQAERCPYFVLQHTKEELKGGYKDFLSRAPIEEIKRVYPDIAVLLWVLNGEEPHRGEPFDDELSWEPLEPPPPPETVELVIGIYPVQVEDEETKTEIEAYLATKERLAADERQAMAVPPPADAGTSDPHTLWESLLHWWGHRGPP
jgi:hypothetical protein